MSESLLLRLLLSLSIFFLPAVWSCADDEDDASPNGDDDSIGNDDAADDDDAPGDDDDNNEDDDNNDDHTGASLLWLHAQTGEETGIFDAAGRQVLLRGVNFNHLGDYFQAAPELPTVAALGADDWDDAATLGMNVIRLVTSWSAWEPERDSIDQDYLARVRSSVAEANARGLYVVIDMHQDAWSKFVFTPAAEECPAGARHQIGWDGAPDWATFTDDEPTCTPGSREESPAVRRAWDNFYGNRDGIRDELVELWSLIAAEFADHPGVAGYDLLNEPGNGTDLRLTYQGLTAFYRDALAAIRAAETRRGSPGHIVFFEPSVHGVPPAFNLSDDNLIFAPHNYFESIVQGPEGLLDFSFWLYQGLGRLYRTDLWCGEYGSFGDEETNEAWMARFAELEDRFLFAGGAWWQWEQECGDPHDVNYAYPPTPEWIEQQAATCGDARMRPTLCVSRAYPRAAPGQLTSLAATPCGESLSIAGRTESTGTADLWFPSASSDEPIVTGSGIASVYFTAVPGGWRIGVRVEGEYIITVVSALKARGIIGE